MPKLGVLLGLMCAVYKPWDFLSTFTVCPTNVELQAGTSPTLSWNPPAQGGYFGLANFTAVWKESSDSERWTPISTVDRHQTYVSFDTSQFSTSGYVAVQANYQGKSITSEKHRLDLPAGNSIILTSDAISLIEII